MRAKIKLLGNAPALPRNGRAKTSALWIATPFGLHALAPGLSQVLGSTFSLQYSRIHPADRKQIVLSSHFLFERLHRKADLYG